MRAWTLSALLALACACGDDSDGGPAASGSAVEGFYLYPCEGECAELGLGGSGIYLSDGKIFDASLSASESALCVWEQLGTYTPTSDGFQAVWPADEESPAGTEAFTLEDGVLTGSAYPDEPLERVEGELSIASPADCEG